METYLGIYRVVAEDMDQQQAYKNRWAEKKLKSEEWAQGKHVQFLGDNDMVIWEGWFSMDAFEVLFFNPEQLVRKMSVFQADSLSGVILAFANRINSEEFKKQASTEEIQYLRKQLDLILQFFKNASDYFRFISVADK